MTTTLRRTALLGRVLAFLVGLVLAPMLLADLRVPPGTGGELEIRNPTAAGRR